MKVLLIKDVYKLGRAGEIKKVADGFGRNYLIPQKLAVPATDGSLRLAQTIGKKATERRAVLNQELASVAEVIKGLVIEFSVKAGETGKLYGSVTSQMIADEIKAKHDLEIDKRQFAMEPIRVLGEYNIPIHLTLDLVPEVTVVVRREGEAVQPLETYSEIPVEAEAIIEEESLLEEIVVENPEASEEPEGTSEEE